MAGIGFQLRKILGKGDLGSSVGAVVSGIFVVAGPWLVSIASMVIMQSAFARSGFTGNAQFQVSIVYCFALSLSLFSGLHHHFTRMAADLAWADRQGEATVWMLRFIILVIVLSIIISAPGSLYAIPTGYDGAILLRVAFVSLFAIVNVLWIVMLFISSLRDYRIVAVVFIAGMAISVFATIALSATYGSGGAVLGYASGLLAIDIAFIIVGVAKFPPVKPTGGYKSFIVYAKKYWALILSGFFFYCGQWLDKFYFWVVRGSVVEDLRFRIYGDYDAAVYITGLSIIPGLVYFIIMTETHLYTDLRHFLFTLNHSSWKRIQKAKQRMISGIRHEFWNQSVFQAVFSLGLAAILLALDGLGFHRPELWFALAASYFQFTLLSILVYLYYFELYTAALLTAFLYFMLNGIIAAIVYTFIPGLPAGIGHLVAGATSSLLGYTLMIRSVNKLDRIVFMRALG